ncbi:MAG: amino acid adenylation domain-containing protein, partial [Nitrosomonas sp. PRO4]|nr:amino acid adenylation domain-containing protein [Nitrosomonas sp. PRO4]
DNFFELGGDSILSLQIVTKARRAGWKITPRQLFERQTIAALEQVVEIDKLASNKENRYQAACLADYFDTEKIASLPIKSHDIVDIYPLSPTQEGMLFHTLEAPGTGLYINQVSVEVEGLDPARLVDAWQAMIDRHAALRTGFIWQAGKARPLQVVYKQAQARVTLLDWHGETSLKERIKALADEDLRSGFDFLNPPLARLSLIRIGENRHQLIWTKHHILLDGWGDSILTNDWLRKYNGEQLAPVGPEYGVYIQWLEKQDKLKLQHFWQTELKSLEGPTLLARSVNKQPIENSESDFAQIYTQLSIDETRQLQAFAQHMHVTLNTFVQAAWAILLHRYSGKQTVVFGTTVAGRPAGLPKADEMIGLFINTIPIPVERRSDLTVAKYLSILQQTNARLRDYEYTALADIQRWAGCSGQPLFDSIVVFENYPLDATIRENELGGLRFGEMDGKGLTGYAMDLQVTVENGLEIEYSYSCSDFTDQFVLDLRRYMELLMREMMVNPQRTIGELGWVDKNELNQLLKWRCEASGAETFTRAYTPVHHLIERNASQRPDAIALLMGEQEMSYGKLNARANQLAHLLLQIGAGPEVRIGVAMERSLDIIVALLAILKTGSAYVPIDVDYPADRIAFMVRDSQVSLVLTQSTIQNKLKFDVSISTLAIDEAPLPDNAVENPDITVHEQNLAYIIYTSGSTGQPKGVAVTHGPLTMHCAATARIYGMNANSCELLFMSFSFDGAHERWLTALTVGAGLAIRSQELWTAEQTYDALHHYGITNAAFPPAYLGQVAEWAAPRNDPPPVELYVFGGEAMPKASYDLVCRTLRPRLLINGYGPTETVVTPLIWKTDAGSSFDCAYAPIGRPVGDRTVYVLDVDMQPVPIGRVGELYIGGYGLARGYLGRPGLTAERFVADPFDSTGGRLYRTGDLVRWMRGGNIEYIGRSDYQVKIRGFRIELGEIEARIREIPGVADAAVIVHEGANGVQLAAYMVTTIKQSVTDFLSNVKQALGKRLPDYMMPAHFVILPALPRLPSGKLDLKSLPEPDATVTDSHYQEPSTLEAKALAAIWQEVLGIERVGETDNFFALGGDSLSSLKVMARIRNLTEVKLDFKLRDLIQRPTIASLLGLDSAPRSHLNNLLALNRFDKHSGIKTLFCVHAGLGTVFDYQPLARSLQDVCGVYGIPCRMLSDPAFQDTSLHQMAEDYCAMIQLKQPEGPYHVLGWSLGGSLAALIAALLEEKGYQVAFLGLIDPYIPGTEVSEVDDWRQDLIDYVSVAITDNASLTVEMLLSRKVPLIESKHAINAVLQEALSVTPIQKYPNILNLNQGYAEMGVEELTNIFMVARRLKALSLQTKTLKPLKVQSTCWWASDRDRADQHTLMAQIRSAYRDSMIIDTDHFGIVRADPLLKAIKTLLHRAIPDSGSDQALSLPDNYAG